MAVSTTNGFSGPFLTNGVTTVFPFTFTAPSTNEVDVVLRAADGSENSANGYSVSLTDGGGGAVEFGSAPASGQSLFIILDPQFTQDIEFENGSAWVAEPVNEGYDRSATRDQALKRDVQRAFKVPLGEGDFTVPPETQRAGKFMAFGEFGEPVAVDAIVNTDMTDDGMWSPDDTLIDDGAWG